MDSIVNGTTRDLVQHSWTTIFTHSMMRESGVVFWLIFSVSFILLVLKAIKYAMKWRKKKLSTSEAVGHLNEVLGEFMHLITQQKQQPQTHEMGLLSIHP